MSARVTPHRKHQLPAGASHRPSHSLAAVGRHQRRLGLTANAVERLAPALIAAVVESPGVPIVVAFLASIGVTTIMALHIPPLVLPKLLRRLRCSGRGRRLPLHAAHRQEDSAGHNCTTTSTAHLT